MATATTTPPDNAQRPLSALWTAVRRSRFAWPLIIAWAVLLLIVSEVGFHNARAAIDRSNQASVARLEVAKLLTLALSAETGQRGYLITQQTQYREPYERAVAEVGPLLARIDTLYAGQPERRGEIDRLREAVARKMSELQTTMELHGDGREDAWRDLTLSGIGLEHMRALEQLANGIATVEARRLAENQKLLDRTLLFNRFGIVFLVLVSVAVLALYGRQERRTQEERASQQRALQAEKDRLEAEVGRRTLQITAIARHLQTVREDERSRLARELHDELGGLLTAAKLDVARMRGKLQTAPPEVAERLAHLVKALDAGIALKRRIIEDLRPSTLTNLGLRAALEVLCTEFNETIESELIHDIDDVALAPDVQLTVYRLVQEGLTNIAKHAQAKRISVELHEVDDHAELLVRDDGVGFEPAQARAAAHGMAGMQFRVESSGGEFQIDSAPGEGTVIMARLPLLAAQMRQQAKAA